MNSKSSLLNNNFKNQTKIKRNRTNQQSNNSVISVFFKNHKLAFKDGVNNLYHASISNLLTIFILGITLALPIILHLIINNVNNGLSLWQSNLYQYSIYLKNSYNEQQANDIQSEVNNWPEIASTSIIHKQQGLQELKEFMGLEKILDELEHNPLPTVIIIKLKPKHQNIATLKKLLNNSKKLNGVTNIEADIFWLEKVVKILEMSFMAIYIFSMALGMAVLLVIGNTIRLNLQSKQTDMSIYSLLGATNAYIRRPYLYGGALYGLLTGLIAIAIAKLLYGKLYHLVSDVGYTELFNNKISFISNSDIFSLLICSSLLGWLGARITLYWQLKGLQKKLVEL